MHLGETDLMSIPSLRRTASAETGRPVSLYEPLVLVDLGRGLVLVHLAPATDAHNSGAHAAAPTRLAASKARTSDIR